MATMNISLPDAMKGWVETQSQSGKYSNSSDYIRDLIRKEQERAEKIARMDILIDEAILAGDTGFTAEQILDQARSEYKRKKVA